MVVYIMISMMIWCFQKQAMSLARAGCEQSCGIVEIPFPFGMHDPKCYVSDWFEIECRNDSGPEGEKKPYLRNLNLEVLLIDLAGLIWIMNPIHESKNCESKSKEIHRDSRTINLGESPCVYSYEFNSFVGVGCGSIASFWSKGEEVGGCVSKCDNSPIKEESEIYIKNCRGRQCCETSLPIALSEFNVSFRFDAQDYCVYGMFRADYFKFTNTFQFYSSFSRGEDYDIFLEKYQNYWDPSIKELNNLSEVPAVLEWEIPIETFNKKLNDSVISKHAMCGDTSITQTPSGITTGKRCSCPYDYGTRIDSNPYIPGGCKFSGHLDKNRAKWATLGICSSLGTIVFLLALWCLSKVLKKKIAKKRREKFFKQNGGLLLEQRISTGEVNVDKIKLFSFKDLGQATDDFNINRVLGRGGQGTVYKGMLVDGRIVAVKQFKVNRKVEEFINEFVILSQINHRNVVKLLGCCLETEIPLLVYEFIPNGNLYEYLHGQNDELLMTWAMRLRIATEIAGALYYLHSAVTEPIYHRDIKSTNILLDGKYKAKVADFGASRMVSIEATHLTTEVQGTFGYLDPEYFYTGQLTEKSDVYSFGVVLVELLTGQKPISSAEQQLKSLASHFLLCMQENRLFDIIDERITKEGEKEHIIVVANLARRCLEMNGRKRPCMKKVTLELESIQKSEKLSSAQEYHEELQLAGMEDNQFWASYSTTSNSEQTSDSKESKSEIMPILIE